MSHPLASHTNKIICGDARQVLQRLADESIDCVVTSPPYWGLRDYGVRGQLGLEPTISEYLDHLCAVFEEVRRVLKAAGTCWVNLGDTSYADQGGGNRSKVNPAVTGQLRALPARTRGRELPAKSLCQIPARFALAMAARGWVLRNEIIWWKPNCMPSSARDRFTMDFEKVFFFVKQKRYYFDQQFEPVRDRGRLSRRLLNPTVRRKRRYGDARIAAFNPQTAEASRRRVPATGRNKRCVWALATRPYLGNHFAVYPPELIETPIQAGCPKGGIVLDPFLGSGATALTARKLGRKFIGIDINPAYVRQARSRLAQTVG